MAEWSVYRDDVVRIDLPGAVRPLKSQKFTSGMLLKGRAIKARRDSTLLIAVDPGLSPDYAAGYLKSIRDPDPDDRMFRYHYYGPSKSRPGGVEVSVSAFPPDNSSGIHRWMIAFPEKDRWLYLDVSNTGPGLTWGEFEPIARRIICSLHLSDAS